MKRSLLVLVLLAGGCDRLFGVAFVAPDAPDVTCTKLEPDLDDADADCVADAADNCPGHANPDQSDGELDGVGDACDPDPELAGDSLFAFDDFDDPVAAALAWEEAETTGRFVFEPGAVVHAVTGGGSHLRRTMPAPDTAELLVEVALRFDGWGDRALYPRIRLFLDEGASPTQGLYCALDADTNPEALREVLILGDRAGGATKSNVARLDGRHAIRIRMHRTPDLLSCDVVVDGEVTSLPVHQRGASTWPTDRGIGITLSLVEARLEWVAIYPASR